MTLLWKAKLYSYQCLNTETTTQGNKSYTTETPSISYSRYLSRMKEVDLNFSIFFSHFYFLFDLFYFILFLELGLGLEWQDHAVMQQVTWHMEEWCYTTYDTHVDLKAYT